MNVERRYGVRPKIKEREALTSYLFRIAEANGTEFTKILQHINVRTYYQMQSRRYSHLDLFPFKQINTFLLSQLLCMSEEKLLNHTFYPAVVKFYNNPLDEIDNISLQLSLLLETNYRRFCRKCLLHSNGFQLLWQIKDIKVCDIHGITLQSTCNKCGKRQSYIRNQMKEIICGYCSFPLSYGNDEDDAPVNYDDLILNQNKLYTIWKRLLYSNKDFTVNIGHFDRKQSLALRMLYFGQSKERSYKNSHIQFLNKDEIKFLRLLLRGQRTKIKLSIIGIMIRFLMKSEIAIDEFGSISVNQDYINSILDNNPKIELGTCQTPWCKSRGTHDDMLKYELLTRGNETHHSSAICKSCFIPYGYQRNTEVWSEIGNVSNLILKYIQPMLEAGLSRNRMVELIPGISLIKVNELIGYMYNQILIPTEFRYLRDLKPDSELVSKFEKLWNEAGNYKKRMAQKAKSIFGWNLLNFYYNYYNNEVQLYLLSKSRKQEKEPRVHKELSNKLADYMDACDREKRVFSLKEFHEVYGVSIHILNYYNLYDEVAAAREAQKESIKSDQRNHYWSVTREYVTRMLESEIPFNCNSIYIAIGKGRAWLVQNCPDLAQWINDQVKVSQQQQEAITNRREKKIIEETIQYFIDQDIRISKKNVAKYSQIKIEKLVGETELGIYYNEVIDGLITAN
ncbi:hypothetical protein BC351_28945 [Paenibacillus ferrarius]|uniref:TniQ domain-containing protein n=1 Tax=Paenibacillus ferrarius TaxID=1469647 RepID=A0A1V4HJ71_9BACL|nr:TniQ family protein [Paenibacillus ferrarius]OPH56198.1 hypothetical protein BC351_28945 [Paenibacillus ferrarius]